jgi:hypothetical protein
MKKIISAIILLGIQNVFAAKFDSIVESTNENISSLSRSILKIVGNESIYGDCSEIKSFKYDKEEAEEEINTVKQLMLESGTLMTDFDEHSDVTDVSDVSSFFTAENLLDPTFSYSDSPLEDVLEQEEISVVENDRTVLARKIYSLLKEKKDQGVMLFDGLHSFEDGTWNVLSVMDSVNKEITVYSVGFCSTK